MLVIFLFPEIANVINLWKSFWTMFNPILLLEAWGIQWWRHKFFTHQIFIFYLQETRVEKGGCAHMITCSSHYNYMHMDCTYESRSLWPHPTWLIFLRTQINLVYVYSSRPTLLLRRWASLWSLYYAEHSIKYWGPGRSRIYKSDWTTLYLKFYGTRITISEKNLRP